jgi:hypothetical protein
MVRRLLLTAATLALAVSVAAQSPQGWKVRIDRSQNAQDPDNTPSLVFKPMGKGLHVKGGPAGTFWNGTTASGNYTLKATFNLQEPSNHTNYYGLVFGGSNLEGASQAYVYFVIAQNGTFLVRQRQGGENVTDVVNRQPNAAVRQPGANGQSSNALEVRVSGDTVSYVVNGTVVHSGPKGGLKTDGLVGVRVNHVLDVEFEGFEVGK